MQISPLSAASFALAAALPAVSLAETVTVQTYDSGYYRNNGAHSPSNPITYTGYSLFTEYRAFFAFSLADVSDDLGELTGASITFYGENGVLRTNADSETAAFYSVETSVDSMVAGTGGTAAFADLGDGDLYATHTINGAYGDPMPEFTIDLSAIALDTIETLLAAAAPEDFAVGSTLISIDASSSQAFWASSYLNPSAELTLTFASATSVPLPAAAPLMAAGLAGLALIARRRRG